MISFFLICDQNGFSIIERYFRNDFKSEIKDQFLRIYKEYQFQPCIYFQGYNFVIIKFETLIFIVATRFNISLSLLQTYLKDVYLKFIFLYGICEQKTLQGNIHQVQELIEHVFDYGYFNNISYYELLDLMNIKPVLQNTEFIHNQYINCVVDSQNKIQQTCTFGTLQYINRNEKVKESVVQFDESLNFQNLKIEDSVNDIDFKFNRKLRISDFLGITDILNYQFITNYNFPFQLNSYFEKTEENKYLLNIRKENIEKEHNYPVYFQELSMFSLNKQTRIQLKKQSMYTIKTNNNIHYKIQPKQKNKQQFEEISIIIYTNEHTDNITKTIQNLKVIFFTNESQKHVKITNTESFTEKAQKQKTNFQQNTTIQYKIRKINQF